MINSSDRGINVLLILLILSLEIVEMKLVKHRVTCSHMLLSRVSIIIAVETHVLVPKVCNLFHFLSTELER